MSDEDELVSAIIQSRREVEERAEERGDLTAGFDAFPEAHYNDYGTRGVADLYIQEGNTGGHLYEIKSASAVRQATGANEVIRQFNKMCDSFFDGSDFTRPTNSLTYELCFVASESTIRHVFENAEIYASVVDLNPVSVDPPHTIVTFRIADSDNLSPLLPFVGKLDIREAKKNNSSDYLAYAKSSPAVFEEYGGLIKELLK